MIDLANLDIVLSATVQALGEGFLPIMTFFTRIGEPPLYIFVTLLLCWCWNYGFGAQLGSLLSYSALVNGMLKILIRAPRPYVVDDRIIPRETEHGLGMPSGHAQVVVTFWGYLASRYKHLALWITGSVMSFCVGISRVYLGVHSLGQVVAGWFVGIAIVVTFITLERKYREWFLRQCMLTQVAAILGLAFVPVIICMLFSGELSAAAAEQLPRLLMFSGMFSGFAIGALVFRKYGTLRVKTSWWKQGLKLCMAVVTVMFYGSAIEPFMGNPEQARLSDAILFLINVLLGVWVTCIAPFLFAKLKLVAFEPGENAGISIRSETIAPEMYQ